MNPGLGFAASPDLVLQTAWWSYPGTPQQAFTWFGAHTPGGTVASGSSPVTSTTTSGVIAYDRPANTQLGQRSLEITLDQIGTRTVLRTDAAVMWLPSRPAGATIPDAVTRIALVATLPDQFGPAARTVPLPPVTDKLIISKIVTLINKLPMAADATTSCPVDTGAQLRISFYTAGGTTPLAVAAVKNSGCRGVSLSVSDGPQNVRLDDRTNAVRTVMSLIGATFPTAPPAVSSSRHR